MSFFDKLKNGLKKTKENVLKQFNDIFKSFVKVDEDMLDELTEVLICADVGVAQSEEIIDELRDRIRTEHITEPEQAKKALISILLSGMGEDRGLDLANTPSVILVIGVNGVGKTTSIAKIAYRLKENGKKVMLCAGDTFRAAAGEQLEEWAKRTDVPIIRHEEGSDPASVVFDAASAAKAKGVDCLIVDTAGRLHNKKNLMDELAKINRVIDRELPGVSRETLLVLDATTGQNAVIQAQEFKNSADITGIVLTKLDGTAKGGVVISINRTLGIPVKFIGVGEQKEDMQEFCAEDFIKALFEE